MKPAPTIRKTPMLSIRLSRVGKKKAPVYRIVVMPKTRDPWANSTEILGHYNPRSKELVVKAERVTYWIEKGAQATDSLWNLLVEHKIITGEKRSVTHLTKKRTGKMADKIKADEDAKVVKAAKAEAEAEKARAEATAKAEQEAAAKEEAEAAEKAAAEAPAEGGEPVEPAPESAPAEEAAPSVEEAAPTAEETPAA